MMSPGHFTSAAVRGGVRWLLLAQGLCGCGSSRNGAAPDARLDAATASRDAHTDAPKRAPVDASRGALPETGTSVAEGSVLDASSPQDASPSSDAARGFVHPGILVDRGQLDFVKAKIAANTAPWITAFTTAKASSFASMTYVAHPVPQLACGGHNTNDVGNGCVNGNSDAIAAYTQALLWYYTGEPVYAANAIAILNAWSSTLQSLNSDLTTYGNVPLVTAWLSEMFPRAAEILRYTNAGWAVADVQKFSAMLTGIFLPRIRAGWPYGAGNWELSMADGTANIGVFTDDLATFTTGVNLWKARVPAYFYLTSDGAFPIAPPGGQYPTDNDILALWQNEAAPTGSQVIVQRSVFRSGREEETCRDFVHMALGTASTVNLAETARIQGTDLYTDEQSRITAAFELSATYLNEHAAGAMEDNTLCGIPMNAILEDSPTWEIGYNEYVNRKGLSLPNSKVMIARIRPTGADPSAFHQMAWETLTHAETGSAGIP
jgi:hypothetical protein